METLLDCGHAESPHSSITRGYGIDAAGKKHCYACCAEQDKKQMREEGKTTLYLSGPVAEPGQYPLASSYKITNWPGSLELKPHYVKTGRHNMAGVRYDVYFTLDGRSWHGVQYGNNTQILHCKKVKG